MTSKNFFIVDQPKDGLPPPPEGYLVIDCKRPIGAWIEVVKPISEWKWGDVPAYSGHMDRYIVSEQLYTEIALRFS